MTIKLQDFMIEIDTRDHENDARKVKTFEDLLNHLGGFSWFQILVLFLLLMFEIPSAFVTFIPIFVGEVPPTWNCDNETVSFHEICSCTGTKVPIDENFNGAHTSILSEWDLICDNAWVVDFSTTIQMIGMFVGSFFGSMLADWYGRKHGFLSSIMLLSMGSVISATAINPYIYVLGRFICGAGVTSFTNISLVSVVEIMTPDWRSLSNCVGPTGEGIMILSILAYFIRGWRNLYLATIVPFSLIVLIYPFIPESPRWLIRHNRLEEAHKVICYMAKVNRKPAVSFEVIARIADQEKQQQAKNASSTMNKAGHRYSYLDFIRDKSLRITSLYNMAIWFALSLTYYGISFNIRNVEGNIYLNVFFMGLANAVGQRAALLINNRLGRRKSLLASMSFSALFLVTLALCEIFTDRSKLPSLVITLCLMGLAGMASARSATRLLSGESFPTVLRTMGMGIGGITANIAAILTPQLAYLGSRWPSIPFFIFAIVSVGGSLISFLMSETTGRPLDEVTPDKNSVDSNKNRTEPMKCEINATFEGDESHFQNNKCHNPDLTLFSNSNSCSGGFVRSNLTSESLSIIPYSLDEKLHNYGTTKDEG